jgi:hypothetical protein
MVDSLEIWCAEIWGKATDNEHRLEGNWEFFVTGDTCVIVE